MLKREEHEAKINELISFLNVEGVDQAKLSLLINDLRTNYDEVETTFTKQTNDIKTYQDRSNELAQANMDLLLKGGVRKQDIETIRQEVQKKQGQEVNEPDEKILTLEEIADQL